MNRVNYKSFDLILNLVLLVIIFVNSSYASSDCYPILNCSPEIAALDYYSINTTIDIKCTFRKTITDPLDIMWLFQFEKNERMALDADGQVLPPFKHQILHINESFPNSPHSVSILKVPLLNSSYFTNYTIWTASGQCYLTVRLNLKERALGYTNSSSKMTHCLIFIFIMAFISIWSQPGR